MQELLAKRNGAISKNKESAGILRLLRKCRTSRAYFHHFGTMTHTPGIGNFSALTPQIGNFLVSFAILSIH